MSVEELFAKYNPLRELVKVTEDEEVLALVVRVPERCPQAVLQDIRKQFQVWLDENNPGIPLLILSGGITAKFEKVDKAILPKAGQ